MLSKLSILSRGSPVSSPRLASRLRPALSSSRSTVHHQWLHRAGRQPQLLDLLRHLHLLGQRPHLSDWPRRLLHLLHQQHQLSHDHRMTTSSAAQWGESPEESSRAVGRRSNTELRGQQSRRARGATVPTRGATVESRAVGRRPREQWGEVPRAVPDGQRGEVSRAEPDGQRSVFA